jgi:hypothetical protein
MAFVVLSVFWKCSLAFCGHFLSTAHQGNATCVFRYGTAGAGFFHHQFKAAGVAIVQITFFHITTIRHG